MTNEQLKNDNEKPADPFAVATDRGHSDRREESADGDFLRYNPVATIRPRASIRRLSDADSFVHGRGESRSISRCARIMGRVGWENSADLSVRQHHQNPQRVPRGGTLRCDPVQNQRVGDTGFERSPISSGNEALAVEGNVKCNALADDSSAIDSNLQSLIRAWPSLSESVRKEILKHLPSPSSR